MCGPVLLREADALAEEAEGKAVTKMNQLLPKSKALQRAHKDKPAVLKALETKIDATVKGKNSNICILVVCTVGNVDFRNSVI